MSKSVVNDKGNRWEDLFYDANDAYNHVAQRVNDMIRELDALARAAEAHLNATAQDGSVQTGTWIALQAALARRIGEGT